MPHKDRNFAYVKSDGYGLSNQNLPQYITGPVVDTSFGLHIQPAGHGYITGACKRAIKGLVNNPYFQG